VPSYLVETYVSRADFSWKASRERRARTAVEHLSKLGVNVQFQRTIHVPEDEMCFFVFEASSPEDAALAAAQAGLEPLRVVEAISSGRR
jgi:hypothetical protein